MLANVKQDRATVCVIGLGYVGLPLARALSRKLPVVGFDVDPRRVAKLNDSYGSDNLTLTDQGGEISKADVFIICVPTPVTPSKEPDLSFVEGAALTVGRNIRKGSVVVLESTVYPGVTEEIVAPVVERESRLRCGRDFKVGYSPERIDPADPDHSIDRITKVVSGMDVETTAIVAELYSKVAPGVFVARDIRTAEAAKVIENTQRDLNIALVNELALIFDKMGISTRDVLDAASTKWNFQRYSPGLVGGHCIPVDPYYLVHKARLLGYHPQVIPAGRAINDYMPKHVAEMTIKSLNEAGKVIKGSTALIMGLTFKQNVSDIRETPSKEVIKELAEYGVKMYGYDPLLEHIEEEFGIKAVQDFRRLSGLDAVIVTVAHDAFRTIGLDDIRAVAGSFPVMVDVRGLFDRAEAVRKGFLYRTL
ncbi:MAG: nucleotide sugar dehydrogenase [Chloroflexi bacterium]|nr:nucleotide sugar dehydrogenase [Chloroflexota bacterium]